MTLTEAKDQVAKKYDCKDFSELLLNIQLSGKFRLDNEITETLAWNEAAELYARSKWDEACEKCAELACVDNIGTDGEAYILNHKPEFK